MKKICAVGVLCLLTFAVFSQNTKTGLPVTINPAQIDIVRDDYGVPHIFAKTDAEVAYGLAWAHAEDDFDTIQKAFLVSKGMLGLVDGKEGATVDYIVHLFRIRELVETNFDKEISPDYKLILQAYCDGLNAYATKHPKEVLEKKSLPYTPYDLIAYSVLQLVLGCGVEDALKQINGGTVPLARWKAEGSNGFAFNSKITEDGNVYFTINTHHNLEGQVAWYEAHVSSEEGWNILGGLFPGSPVIFTGINDYLAWTHTVNYPDRLDVYQLEMHPENPLQYKVDDQWLTLEETTVKLKVKLSGGFNINVKRKAYWSIYGPTLATDSGVFSLRTPALMDIRGLEQWFRMNKARSFSEFKRALKMQALPGYNVIYADRYDTIYYLSNGKIPVRDPRYNWQETLPGNTSQTLWHELHSLEDLPQVLNPPAGYVYNTNHSAFKATAPEYYLPEENYDVTMGYETHENNRSRRVQELLQQHDKVSYEDFKRMKYDLQLPRQLAYPVNIDTIFLLKKEEHPDLADVIETLYAWDRKATIESKGAAVFAVFFYYVAARYQRDPLYTSMSKQDCIEALRYTKQYLLKYFGTTDIILGDYQRLVRGAKSLPLPGIPDVLACMLSRPARNGRVKGTIGESYIALVKFTPSGPEIETMNCFGASNRPNSVHYDDQMELFQQQKTRRMTLDKDEIYKKAKAIYHPEGESTVLLTAKLNDK